MGGAAPSGDVKLSNETANRLTYWPLQDNPHAFGVPPLLRGNQSGFEINGEPYWLPEQTAGRYRIASARNVRVEPPGVARFR